VQYIPSNAVAILPCSKYNTFVDVRNVITSCWNLISTWRFVSFQPFSSNFNLKRTNGSDKHTQQDLSCFPFKHLSIYVLYKTSISYF